MPILGLYADHSGLANHEYMNEHFPAMDYHEIPATGHFLMMEKPEEFNQLLLAFLAKQSY
jgi:pimeloyl-ACP methyl ester carboxylesterase